MESFKFFGGRVGAFCFSFGIFLLLGYANAAENRAYPTANVNLNPLQQWRSAYFCLLERASAGACASEVDNQGRLTPQGKLNLSGEALVQFCNPGNCADHIRHDVLDCIYLVHHHFRFINNATVKHVNDSINTACANPSSGLLIDHVPKSSGIKVYQKKYVSIVSGLLVFLAIFNNM